MKKNRPTHIMLDLETLGTRADAAIISIGAVKFDPYSTEIGDDGFYASVSIDSNTQAGRHISEDTLNWWMGQSPEAQKVFKEPKITLASALDSLIEWIDHPDYIIWCNGANFDEPMITHALKTHDVEPPWKFWNVRCYRTISSMPAAKKAEKIERRVKHNALDDAIYQAQMLQSFFKEMRGVA